MHPDILKLIEDVQSLNPQEIHARAIALQDFMYNILIDLGGKPTIYFAKQMFLISNHRAVKKEPSFRLCLRNFYEISKKYDIWHLNEEETILDLLGEADSLDLISFIVFDIRSILNRKLFLQQGGLTPHFIKIVTSMVERIQELSDDNPRVLLILDECKDYIHKIQFMKKKTINFIKFGYHQPLF